MRDNRGEQNVCSPTATEGEPKRKWTETLISELVTRAIPVPNAEIRNQKVSVASETLWFLISELEQSLFPIQKSDIRKFLNLQKLSDSWFLNCLSYQHLLPIQKLEIRKFLNLQKLSGVLFSRRWRLMSFHKRRAECVATPHIATYRISGTPLISIVYPRWNVRTILPVIYLLATQTVLIWHATSTRNRCRAIPVARVTERPCKAKCPEEALDLTWLLASGPAYFLYMLFCFLMFVTSLMFRSTKGAPNLWQCHILPHIG